MKAIGRARSTPLPVHPGDLVVLAIGVVVAVLGAARPRRPSAASACPASSSSVAITLRRMRSRSSRIAGSSVGPSTPQFQLRLSSWPSRLSSPLASLCLLVVGDEVGEREAVMGGDEVDARPGPPAAMSNRSAEPSRRARQRRQHAVVALPEAAHVVAVAAVPLGPARREIAELVAVRADVPRLGDQLDAATAPDPGAARRRSRVRIEGASSRGRATSRDRSGSRRRAFLDPVAQRIHDHLQHARVAQVERVAAAGGVEIVARVVAEHVVAGVVDAAERQRRARAGCPRPCGCRRRRGSPRCRPRAGGAPCTLELVADRRAGESSAAPARRSRCVL